VKLLWFATDADIDPHMHTDSACLPPVGSVDEVIAKETARLG
jgi:hypothetical protein